MMDLLERARALAACSLFAELAPAVVIRLAERARAIELAPGERRTDDAVWVVAEGTLAIAARGGDGDVGGDGDGGGRGNNGDGDPVGAGAVVGLVRVIAPATPAVDAVASGPATVLALDADDVRDVLEEDPAALTALAAALARVLLEGAA